MRAEEVVAAYVAGRCDMTGRELSRVDLSGRFLPGMNFSRARLRNARLRGANLQGCRFTGADVRGADFRGAHLAGADFTETVREGRAGWWIGLGLLPWMICGLVGLLTPCFVVAVMAWTYAPGSIGANEPGVTLRDAEQADIACRVVWTAYLGMAVWVGWRWGLRVLAGVVVVVAALGVAGAGLNFGVWAGSSRGCYMGLWTMVGVVPVLLCGSRLGWGAWAMAWVGVLLVVRQVEVPAGPAMAVGAILGMTLPMGAVLWMGSELHRRAVADDDDPREALLSAAIEWTRNLGRIRLDPIACLGETTGLEIAPRQRLPDVLIGRCINGRWRVEGCLGQGGQGWIYEVRWTARPGREELVGDSWALKLLRPYREAVTREREGPFVNINDSHLLSYRDMGTVQAGPAKGLTYILMELGGVTLQAYLKEKGRMESDEARRLWQGLASGVWHLHQRDIEHGDIKPANIVRVGSVWKLGDFGTSRYVSGAESDSRGGTEAYQAPERRHGVRGLPSDVWAVGLVLQQCLTGIRSPKQVASLPSDFDAVVDGCLEPDPTRRWTIEQVVTYLDDLGGTPGQDGAVERRLGDVPPLEEDGATAP